MAWDGGVADGVAEWAIRWATRWATDGDGMATGWPGMALTVASSMQEVIGRQGTVLSSPRLLPYEVLVVAYNVNRFPLLPGNRASLCSGLVPLPGVFRLGVNSVSIVIFNGSNWLLPVSGGIGELLFR